MSSISLGLDHEDYDREYSNSYLMKRIILYLRPYKGNILIIITSIIVGSLSEALIPLYISQVIDNLRYDFDKKTIQFIILLVLFFTIINFTFEAIREEITARTVQSTIYDIRNQLFIELIEQDMKFYDETSTGKLISRVSNDSREFGTAISLLSDFLAQIVVVLFIFSFLAFQSIKLTILLIIFGPFMVLTALAFRKVARRVTLSSQKIIANINALIQEVTNGIFIAKAFRAEKKLYQDFEKINNQSYKVNLKRGMVFDSIFPILLIEIAIGTSMLIFFGGLNFINAENSLIEFYQAIPGGSLTTGEWFLFLIGLNVFFYPLVNLSSFWSQFQIALSASERIFSILDNEKSIIQNNDFEIMDTDFKIEFKDVTFSYNHEINVFEDFNLKINSNETVAIVGHTGAGKSTISKLLMRYYEFQSGKILINNKDIRDLDLEKYRKSISFIPQDGFLFNSTILENMIYGLKNNPQNLNRLNLILKQMNIMDWINRLDNGLDTKISERGNNLSTGQRQLIILARVLMRQPKLLIMDEATSSIDPYTEVMVQKSLDLAFNNRTSIVIAHRLSTIKKADRIIVLYKGKIVEEGQHEELLSISKTYSNLYQKYFAYQSLN